MEEKKFIVIYSLVSSAAKRYLESECLSGNEDFIIYLNNHDVSATKLKMNQRTKLTDLLRLIKDGKVKKVISYNIDKLKQELLHFLSFDELTPEILHCLINRIDIKDDGTPIIHYRLPDI